MKHTLAYLCIALSFFTQAILSQATFTTSVSKNKLGVNQRVKIIFSINKQGADNFSPPSFKNFKVVAGPSQSINQSWINGKVTFSQSYTYMLQPKNIGTFTVPGATIELNGEKLTSNTVKITVSEAVEIPQNPNDPQYIASQNVHLVAEISKSKPYVGQGIYVEYKLYVSDNISVKDFSVTESPQYNGFWNQDINIKTLQIKNGTYNGENYRYIVLKKALLIPTKSGKLSIEPMKMDILIGVPTGRGDFFGNPITRNIQKSFASPKKIISVKELPLAGKPENFTGAVGDYEFKITASRNDLKANESSQIKVSVSGKGNLKLFEIPTIVTPKELEVFTPEHKENVTTTLTGLKGSITDLYSIVPQYKGKYKIPKVAFSFFSLKENAYKTITTEDLYVNVLEGKEIVETPKNTIKKDVTLTGSNFRYIQTSTTLTPIVKETFFRSNLFYLLLLLPLISIPIGIFIFNKARARNNDLIGVKQRKADRLAKKYLSEAKKQLGEKEAFYVSLEKALHNYLKAKLQVETSDISKAKITQILESKQVDNSSIQAFITVLDDCDFARFTPITNVMMNDEFEKAKQVITALDKQL